MISRPGRRLAKITASVLLLVLVVAVGAAAWLYISFTRPFPTTGPRIYTARSILTIDPARPRAEAVAVDAGRVLAVGSLDDVRRRTASLAPVIDDRFADDVLVAGFIDPHLHPTLAATILPLEIVSAVAWNTPRGRTVAVRTPAAFHARLRELDRQTPSGEWLLVWGYHELYHGPLSRADLDAISQTRPVFVWQRSVHEMFFNTAALERLGLTEAAFAAVPQADWATGHIWEAGLFTLAQPMTDILAAPATYRRGLSMMREVLHRGGLTTVGEQGFPQVSGIGEWLMLQLEMSRTDTPFRFALVPNAMYLMRDHDDAAAAERAASRWLTWSTERVRLVKHAKYYADGAIFSQLMQMSAPYLDGHHGEWMMPPEQQREVLRAFADAGWSLHVHVNGDAGLDMVLDQVESELRPDADRRIVLEHYGYAREDQHARVKRLGVVVSNNPYYLYELAPIYARHGLGPQRAADIAPLGGLLRAGVPFSFHSDFPMAPAEPLRLIATAVNRVASDGAVWGDDEKIPLDAALRAVTIEAAWSLGLENEIGSIEEGKRADFTVLGADPYEVEPAMLGDIAIRGTVLEGVPHPLPDE